MANAVSAQAATDVNTAYTYLSGLTCGNVIKTTLGSNQVHTPDVYCIGDAVTLSGNLILDGQGNPNSLFISRLMVLSLYSLVLHFMEEDLLGQEQ